MKRRLGILWLGMIVLTVLFASGTSLPAAPANAETRDWNAALKDRNDAKSAFLAGLAEAKFADFVKRYPNSDHYAEAIVHEAETQFIQEKYDALIALLAAEWPHAGNYADQFAYLTAQAWEKKKNYTSAADNYARLAQESPDSPLRPQALLGQAEAHSKLDRWPEVIADLGRADGPFQQLVKTNKTDDPVVSQGLLLLGRAYWQQKDYPSAEKVLSVMPVDKLSNDLKWYRLSLLCRVLLADDKAKEALQNSTNLFVIAENNADLKAKSSMLQGQIQESLGQLPDAIRTYEANLNADLPMAQRSEAILRIVELLLRQNQTDEAVRRLDEYLIKHPDERGADFGLLLLGAIRLKEYYQARDASAPPATTTNLLQSAKANFQQLLKQFPNSSYTGKAQLYLGWCFLNEGKMAESQAAFTGAVTNLGFNEDQAVARFKLGDIFLEQKNYAAAVTNYLMIVEQYRPVAADKNDPLFEQALYQIVQADLAQTNMAGAEDATKKILDWFPNGQLADRSMLLVGQDETPARAREAFSRLIKEHPQSKLLPEVKLAIARTYEKETNWASAVTQYKAWVEAYPDNPSLPRAEFSLALAEYSSGDETNAVNRFTDFVTRFQTNAVACNSGLPALAKFWVGDYYWGKKDYQKAELAYKEVFNKWPDSSMALEALLMAGKSAVSRQSPQEAIVYFTSLTALSNCPPDLKARALFARADATNFKEAIPLFQLITATYTNDPISARAWGRMGNCYYTLAGAEISQPDARQLYVSASNAFHMATNSELADISTRSEAEVLLGDTLMKLSELSPAADSKQLRMEALDLWLTVMHVDNLRNHEQADRIWVEEAALRAGKMAEDMGDWAQAIQYYQSVLEHFPFMQKRIDRARQMQGQVEKK